MNIKKLKYIEIQYRFSHRSAGESKMSLKVIYDFFIQIIKYKFFPFLPFTAISFLLIAISGLLLHLFLIGIFLGLEYSFMASQLISSLIIIFYNYILNNIFTFKSNMLSGRHFFIGYFKFFTFSLIGVISNLSFSNFLYDNSEYNFIIPAFCGALIGSVYNYYISKDFVWRLSK